LVGGRVRPVYVVPMFLWSRGEWCVVICAPLYVGWEVVKGSMIDLCYFLGFNEAFYGRHGDDKKPDLCNAPSRALGNLMWV
jgi:hypothetical protein